MMNNSVRSIVFRTIPSISRFSPFLQEQTIRALRMSPSNVDTVWFRDVSCDRQIRCIVSSSSSDDNKGKRRLDVSIVGAPNAGKSQLLNSMMGTTVAAVSRKRHTTRSGILAALTHQNVQLVFVDTPGYLRLDDKTNKGGGKKHILQTLMSSSMKEMEMADYTLIVVDAAKKITDELKEALTILMMRAAASHGRMEDQQQEGSVIYEPRDKFAIVLNKVDLVDPKSKLLEIATELGIIGDSCVKHFYYTQKQNQQQKKKDQMSNKQDFNHLLKGNKVTEPHIHESLEDKNDSIILDSLYPPVFFVSALKQDGVDEVVKHMINYSTPCSDWALPPESLTDMSDAERVEEIIREKLYRCLHREVPHQIEQINRLLVKIPSTKSNANHNRIVRIDQDLIVRTKSHARLVTGKGGMTLKRIKETSNQDLNKLFGCPVQLNLHVKLKRSNQPRGNEVEAERVGIVHRPL